VYRIKLYLSASITVLSYFTREYALIGVVAGGVWQPDAQQLAALRRDIDRRSNRIKQCLRLPGMRKEYFGGIKDNEGEVVKTFVDENKESALKTKPKVSEIVKFS
jgi:Conserved hypothetical protein (DUF2461)